MSLSPQTLYAEFHHCQTLLNPDQTHQTPGLLFELSPPFTRYLIIPIHIIIRRTPVTSRARSRDRTPTSDPDRTHRTSWTSLRTFCSTYALLTHYLYVSLGPHSGLRLSPDTGPTPLHHPVYPSALPTLFVFTRLHPLPCTGP